MLRIASLAEGCCHATDCFLDARFFGRGGADGFWPGPDHHGAAGPSFQCVPAIYDDLSAGVCGYNVQFANVKPGGE